MRKRPILSALTALAGPDRHDADEPKYTVGVVADRVGVPTATLRSWNQRYGVGPMAHRPGRHRLYSENDISVVRRMHELIGQGATARSAARIAVGSPRPDSGDHAALVSAAFGLDVMTVGRLLDRNLRHLGVLDTWDRMVCPAFRTLESRQAEGVGCIDVEHALSWAVSRSLQRLPITPADRSAAIVLACTPGEAHTLALEAVRAALGERRRGAVMLGADVPAAAVLDAVGRSEQPVTVLLWSQRPHTADAHVVRSLAAHAQVLVGGPGWAPRPPKGRWLQTLRDAVEHIVSRPTNASLTHR